MLLVSLYGHFHNTPTTLRKRWGFQRDKSLWPLSQYTNNLTEEVGLPKSSIFMGTFTIHQQPYGRGRASKEINLYGLFHNTLTTLRKRWGFQRAKSLWPLSQYTNNLTEEVGLPKR